MIRRANPVLAGTAVLLAAVWLLTAHPFGAAPTGQPLPKPLAGFTTSAVISVEVNGTRLERTKDLWSVTSGRHPGPADVARVGSLVEALVNLEPARLVSDNPEPNLKEYGLDSPVRIVIERRGGGAPVTIEVGKRGPGGGSFYMVPPDHRIYESKTYLRDRVIPYEGTWRDLKIVEIDPAQLAAVAVEIDGRKEVFTVDRNALRSENGETIVIDRFFESLQPLRAAALADTPPAGIALRGRVALITKQGTALPLGIGRKEISIDTVRKRIPVVTNETFLVTRYNLKPLLELMDKVR
ncbi:MAG: DUF4340 domain-containing protein [Candidatus Hydrogenedentota bacterium]|nr:MAG: DUF4340 domain-containing protein [Candidatus Hydrogenedentota bacterium]